MKSIKELNFPLCLAPMVGLSHWPLRRLILDYMPSEAQTHWPTEMLSSRRLPSENLQTTPETLRGTNESHLIPQILGNEELPIQRSVQRLVQEWGASGIDINMGCPVQKALKHNYGVSLMGDVDYAAKVVEVTKKNSSVPVSVKLRAVGSEKSIPQLVEFVQRLVNSGADWITLHPRTAEQMRKGRSDWSQITALKRAFPQIAIVGNGDVQTLDDVLLMLRTTGADKVMSGRALAARPWMMWQLGERLGFSNPTAFFARSDALPPNTPEAEGTEYGHCLLRLIDYSEESFMGQAQVSEALTLRKLLFYIKTTHVWLEFGHTLMANCSRSQNLEQLRGHVSRFFLVEQRMNPRTELRQ